MNEWIGGKKQLALPCSGILENKCGRNDENRK